MQTEPKPDTDLAVTLDDVRRAQALLEGAVVRTPLVPAARLSARLGAEIFLKLESLQYTGSFKDRGALVKLHGLTPAQRRAGVIAISAGNHAQGVAYHAGRMGIPAVIVMPEGTPFTKIERTRALGAEVVLRGAGMAESAAHAGELAEARGLTLVHPFDDPAIMAGQGTVALEILEAEPEIDAIVAPVGGGGLVSGCAAAAKAVKPGIEVLGVEAAIYPSMRQTLKGEPVRAEGATLAEGIAVKTPGTLTLPIVRALVDEVLLAGEAAIEQAVETLLIEARVLAEGAGAVPLAAVEAERKRFAGKRVALVISGGNIDSRLLSSVLLRGLVRAGRMIRLRVEIIDRPGALEEIAAVVACTGGNIVEVLHQRLFSDVPVKHAELDLTVETRSPEHGREVLDRILDSGHAVRLLSSRAGEDAG